MRPDQCDPSEPDEPIPAYNNGGAKIAGISDKDQHGEARPGTIDSDNTDVGAVECQRQNCQGTSSFGGGEDDEAIPPPPNHGVSASETYAVFAGPDTNFGDDAVAPPPMSLDAALDDAIEPLAPTTRMPRRSAATPSYLAMFDPLPAIHVPAAGSETRAERWVTRTLRECGYQSFCWVHCGPSENHTPTLEHAGIVR